MAQFLAELERMVINSLDTEANEPHATEIERWHKLFGFSVSQAAENIQLHRNDMTRSRVSDELWSIEREEQEALGFDRESYEYALTNGAFLKKSIQITTSCDSPNTTYIVKLGGPICTAESIRDAIQLSHNPECMTGTGESGDAVFCKIDGVARQKLMAWLAMNHPMFRPTIVRLSKSPKQLSINTMEPMLGSETTLPQHRPDDSNFVPSPSQDQYPVWYFFYGNLANPFELQHRLNLKEPATYVPARIYGGKIKIWRGQYRALVDANPESCEAGSAYLLRSKEEEEILQFYETEKYEVVRCVIEMEGGRRENGLVFRFCGREDKLR